MRGWGTVLPLEDWPWREGQLFLMPLGNARHTSVK